MPRGKSKKKNSSWNSRYLTAPSSFPTETVRQPVATISPNGSSVPDPAAFTTQATPNPYNQLVLASTSTNIIYLFLIRAAFPGIFDATDSASGPWTLPASDSYCPTDTHGTATASSQAVSDATADLSVSGAAAGSSNQILEDTEGAPALEAGGGVQEGAEGSGTAGPGTDESSNGSGLWRVSISFAYLLAGHIIIPREAV
jgi:hypothetical protein